MQIYKDQCKYIHNLKYKSKIFLKITRLNTNLQINVNLEIDVDFDMKGNYHSKDGELKSELKENFIVCIHRYIIE